VLYPLSHWPPVSSNSLENLDQVGFEPAPSRVVSEVTLSFTASGTQGLQSKP
jgi:hypothetical protein